jgi:hypothetical protein
MRPVPRSSAESSSIAIRPHCSGWHQLGAAYFFYRLSRLPGPFPGWTHAGLYPGEWHICHRGPGVRQARVRISLYQGIFSAGRRCVSAPASACFPCGHAIESG